MNFTHKKIWALLDDRQGNTSQTLGVAEALGVPFETVQIDFNELIRIPNILINHTRIWAKGASKSRLEPPWPDIVISTARRLGIVASYIKYRNPRTFLAQIQWPGTPASQFDLIAAPKHDNVTMDKNIFISVGAPHRVTLSTLEREATQWRQVMEKYPAPRIALLVGGDSGSRRFTNAHAKRLAAFSSSLAQSQNGSLLATTSRRTSREAEKTLAESLAEPHYLYEWNNIGSSSANPFYGLLGMADAVIATGDSISMCSEACATGKPVYIYAAPDFVSPKHQQFITELYRLGLARPLLETGNTLFTPPFRLDDSETIAIEIKRRCAL